MLHTIIIYETEFPDAKSRKVFGHQATNAPKSNDPNATVRKLCLPKLSEHPYLAVIGVNRIDRIPFGRGRESLNRISYHNCFIESQAGTRWQPKVRLNGAKTKDEGANWHALGNLQ